jgi:hypothetical protein
MVKAVATGGTRNPALFQILGRTNSIGLSAGMRVQILEIGFGKRKVRVLTNSAGQTALRDDKGTFRADSRIGRECWVVVEAFDR